MDLVCVLCGIPWVPPSMNRCSGCGGFCSWGPAKGADPSSWIVKDGQWIPKPVPKDLVVTEDDRGDGAQDS